MRTKPYWTLSGVARGGVANAPRVTPAPIARIGGSAGARALWLFASRGGAAHVAAPRPSPPSRGLALPCVLLRRRFRRSPSSRCPAGAAGLARRGVGGSRAAVPGGAAGPDAAGRGSGGRRRGGGVPAGRAGLHLVRDAGRARRDRGRAGRAAAGRTSPDRVSGRTLFGAPFGGGARGGRRDGDRGAGGPHRAGGRVGVRRGPAARTPRWPVCSRPTTRWGRSSRWPRWPRCAGRPGCRCWWTRRSRSGGGRWRGTGRCWRPARTNGAGRRGSGCSSCGRVCGSRRKGPLDERESGRARRVREHPGDRGGGGLAAGGTGGGGRGGGAAAGADGADPGAGAAAGARTWRWWAIRSGGCPGSSPSPVSMSTGRHCCTSWTARASPSPPDRPARAAR